MERLQGHQLCRRRNQVDDAHHHRAVAKRGVLFGRPVPVEYCRRRLVQYGRCRLVHLRGRGTRRRGAGLRRICRKIRWIHIIQLGTSRLVPREIVTVTRHQYWLQYRVSRIHSRVNVRDNNAGPQHVERLLRILDFHNRRCWLIDVAVPCRRGGTRGVGYRISVRHECGGY